MNNNPDNFSKEGVHLGIGEINDGLQYHTLSMGPITSDEIEYYLDKALVRSDVLYNLRIARVRIYQNKAAHILEMAKMYLEW